VRANKNAMLTTLRIKNLALVSDLTLILQPGYNVITGETGAGKSIIIGALNLVLGQRGDRTLIRTGCDSCSVEAQFEVAGLRQPLKVFLEENGLEPCEDNQLLLKRVFTTAGSNRQFINGSPTTLATLSMLGEWLVDIHGPHDHQSLLHPARQLAILDAYGDLETLREAFAGLFRERAAVEAEKATLIVDEKTYAQQVDLLRHQAGEITAARLHADEATQVEQEFQRASNAARLLQLCQQALATLAEDEGAALTQLGAVGRQLGELQRVDTGATPLLSLHEQAVSTLRELQTELSRYADKVDINPARLAELEERLNLIHSLKRKYGASVVEVIAFGEAARQKLTNLEQREAELARLQAKLQRLEAELQRAGSELTRQRRKVIPKLTKAAMKLLGDLGFQQSHFDIALTTRAQASTPQLATGFDTVEFLFAPNPGEAAHPLRAIASSGEMARVMLALKTVLSAEDDVPVLIFDEVDANVGGETANVVGRKIREIARGHQVLCITHLAPVAAAATSHYLVSKQVQDGRTLSEMRLLDNPSRITELARMLGGAGEAARKHAEALLRTSADTK
jgi:DNA repair protein RecN (Recombination protein N)